LDKGIHILQSLAEGNSHVTLDGHTGLLWSASRNSTGQVDSSIYNAMQDVLSQRSTSTANLVNLILGCITVNNDDL